jgi:hypothetical protein
MPDHNHPDVLPPNGEAVPVKCTASKQGGFDILSGNCPMCKRHLSVNGPGKLICSCGQLLQFA